jgi:hypothetical protein
VNRQRNDEAASEVKFLTSGAASFLVTPKTFAKKSFALQSFLA